MGVQKRTWIAFSDGALTQGYRTVCEELRTLPDHRDTMQRGSAVSKLVRSMPFRLLQLTSCSPTAPSSSHPRHPTSSRTSKGGRLPCGSQPPPPSASPAPANPRTLRPRGAHSPSGMPRWWTRCIEAHSLRRLLSPWGTRFCVLRRSGVALPLPSLPRSRLLVARRGACSGAFSFSTSAFGFGGRVSCFSPPSRCFASSCSQADRCTPSGAMQSVRIASAGDVADALMEALLCFGAASCSIEDTNLGALQEQKIYSDGPIPWQSGKRQLWKELMKPVRRGGSLSLPSMVEVMPSCFLGAPCKSSITALFAAGDDVGEALAMAANSVGLKEMPLYEVEELEDCDWVLEVESQFKPVEVSRGLWIVPKWSQPPDAKALNVIIDPGLAFGTGEHPTTRLCLQWLHHVVSTGDKILDYGTGSGILSIAALKMGAARAIGVDIDPVAISSAEYNASLNNLKPDTLQVFVAPADGDDPVPKKCTDFDVVAANILLNPLVELAERITGYCKPGGLVGVSGILVEQVAQVKEAYSQYLEGIAVSYDNGWACVSGRKKRLVQTSADTTYSQELPT